MRDLMLGKSVPVNNGIIIAGLFILARVQYLRLVISLNTNEKHRERHT